MGTYKAARNNEKANKEEQNIDDIQQFNDAVVDVADKYVNVPIVKGITKAYKGLGKLTNGASSRFIAKTTNFANKITPGGNLAQKMISKEVQSGRANMARQFVNKGKSPSSSTSSAQSSNSSSGFSLSSNIMPSFSKKFLIILPIVCFVVLILLVTTVVASKDNANLDLTNQSSISSSTNTSLNSNFVSYYQYDYKNVSYGYGTTISSAGCGPTAMAMVISTLTGQTVTPIETADWSLKNGYRVQGEGTAWDYFPAIASEYGLVCETLTLDVDSITNTLSQAKPIIISMGPPTFTKNGHYLVLTGITSDGKITIADPNSEAKSQQTWDLSVFINEGSGGLWAFSK